MRPHPLRARNIVVVAPHPDDETIGAFGLLSRARHARVTVLIVSDGAASHPQSVRWPAHRLVPERQREVRGAMAILRLAPTSVRFLGLPDGALDRTGPRLEQALRYHLSGGRRPDLIIGPMPDDDHADHRSVAAALKRAAPRGVRQIGYRVWPVGHIDGPVLTIPLDPATRLAKRRAICGYRTQMGRITDAVAGFTMTWRHLARFVRPVEQFAVLA